jgi:hypothetical protein
MTEAEWLACDNFIPLLQAAVPRLTDRSRKLRLCVCGDKRCSGVLQYPWGLPAIELAERVADGLATDQERAEGAAAVLAWEPRGEQEREEQERAAHQLLADAGFFARLPTAFQYQPYQPGMGTPEPGLSDRFRDIFGNPFRPVTFDPSWLTSDVTVLARGMYDSRDFSAMPILADALQDAGCASDDILDHCRGPGPHVRGCWVCDLVLGKE